MAISPGNSQHADSPNYAGAWAVGFIMPILGTIFMVLRLISKSQTKRKFAADDAVLSVAMLFVWAMCGTFLYGVSHGGIGGHSMLNPVTKELEIGPHDFVLQVILFYFFVFERVAFGLIKIGVIFWYRLIFVGKTFNTLSIGLVCVIAMMSTAFLFTTIFQCGPDPSVWWSGLQEELAKCVDTNAVAISFSAFDLATDICTLVLPIPWLLKLQMTPSKKFAVIATFMLGIISTAAAVARLFIWTWILYDVNLASRDFQGLTTQVLVATVVSAGAAMIGASLPALHPLLKMRSFQSVIRSAKRFGSKDSSRIELHKQSRHTINISDVESQGSTPGDGVYVSKEISVIREQNDGSWRKNAFARL